MKALGELQNMTRGELLEYVENVQHIVQIRTNQRTAFKEKCDRLEKELKELNWRMEQLEK